MSNIRGRNTKPEILIRKKLHQQGFRFRLHDRGLPGKPDIVLPRYHAVIFVNGCFWHGHDCRLFKWPETRPEFWQEKIKRNRINDQKSIQSLIAAGWRVGIVWECSVRCSGKDIDRVISHLVDWLRSNRLFVEKNG